MKKRSKVFFSYKQFATEKWQKMPWQDQGEHARQYQIGYAKAKRLELEIVSDPGRANISMTLIPTGVMELWLTREPFLRLAPKTVNLTQGFYLGKTPITQAQWEAVMGSNPSHFKGADRPVECVSWNDCVSFCQKTGLSLPTEAQWEFACRAGIQSAYYFGNDSGSLGNYAWYDGNSSSQTHPVAQKQPNAYGLYDVVGNVWEFTRTCKKGWVVCKGGGWYSHPQKGGLTLLEFGRGTSSDLGFRVCLPL